MDSVISYNENIESYRILYTVYQQNRPKNYLQYAEISGLKKKEKLKLKWMMEYFWNDGQRSLLNHVCIAQYTNYWQKGKHSGNLIFYEINDECNGSIRIYEVKTSNDKL